MNVMFLAMEVFGVDCCGRRYPGSREVEEKENYYDGEHQPL